MQRRLSILLFAAKWENIGSEVVGGTPEQFGELVRSLGVQLD